MFFEQAREQAEKDFSSNSRDAQVSALMHMHRAMLPDRSLSRSC